MSRSFAGHNPTYFQFCKAPGRSNYSIFFAKE